MGNCVEGEAGVRMKEKRDRARGGVRKRRWTWEGGMKWGDGEDENGKEGKRMG